MTRKTDSPARRMRYLRHYGEKSSPKENPLAKVFADCSPEVAEQLRALDALRALNLVELKEFIFPDGDGGFRTERVPEDWVDTTTKNLRQLFAHFKLHPDNPWSWRLLVSYFAHVEFGDRPKGVGGRSKEWTAELMEKLKEELKTRDLANMPAKQAAKKLSKDKTSAVSGRGVEAIRKRIGEVKAKK